MMHWRARRLLASVPDGTLPEETELELRVHVASCARCRRSLQEFEIAEELLQRMPAAIQPLEWSPGSYRRLTALASWSTEPELPEPGRWRAPVLSLASAFAILMIALMVGHYSPVLDQPIGSSITLAYQLPDADHIPTHWH
ncbi:MAG: zf-HC2 domain-containing protein [Deltaproteobacteria bacterium]|nr:zf-HC2 domain-containing protein [Deltaproteobacteria bacterium]